MGSQPLRLDFAAGSAPEVRDSVRISFGRKRQTVAWTAGLDLVTIKEFLALPCAEGGRTHIRPDLFDHITTGTSR
ncbi:hypothetical protein ABZ178_10890 [Streptomyces massasporeus]|uniref:hypothetical protein n=1 Tax=Streptomyces massasporeus TaxID=67324 RepID=UPI0033A478CA